MAEIHNSDIQLRILDETKIQTSVDDVPNQLGKTIVPVLISNPTKKHNWIERVVKSTTGTAYSANCPAEKQTYVHTIIINYSKDAVNDNIEMTLGFDDNETNELKNIITIYSATTTAKEETIVINFAVPILLKKNGRISLTGNFTAGVLKRSVGCIGYTIN